MTARSRSALAILFLTLMIDIIGIGLMWPILPDLVRELSGGSVADAAFAYGLIAAVYSLMQFLFGPTLGALSDRFGRRPILLISLFGLTIDYIILALAPNLWIVTLARLVGGVLGGSISTASAYIADISPPERRAQNFGLIGVAFAIGFIVGPLAGGLLGEIGPRVPFWVAAVVCFLNLILAAVLLPESLAAENRRPFRIRQANPVGAFMTLTRYPAIAALIVIFFFSGLAERALENTWALFTAYRFEWTPLDVGLSFALIGVMIGISQGGLVRFAVPRLGEQRTLEIGLAVGTLSLLALAFVNQVWMVYVIIVVYCLGWGIVGPAAQALATRAVPANEQGLLQGGLASLTTATGIFGPPVAAGLFGYFIGPNAPFHFPGVSFFIGAVLFLVSLLMARRAGIRAALGGTPVTNQPR